MLPAAKIIFKLIFVLSIAFLISSQPKNTFSQTSPPPIFIMEPTAGETVSGTKNIVVAGEETAQKVWIAIFYDTGGMKRNIYEGVPPQNFYPWNTLEDEQGVGNYKLRAFAQFSGTSIYSQSPEVPITINNTTPPPAVPPPPPPPPASEPPPPPPPGSSPPTSSSGGQQQSSDGEPKVITSVTLATQDKIIVEEDIPVTIGEFDPDVFLTGKNIKIKTVKSLKDREKTIFHFEGTTKPNTLVTLYIFSNPIIVTLKSDKSGFWYYDRDKTIETGKHTVFATIYDEGVTRRSNVVNFFVAKGSQGDLVLRNTVLQRLIPYVGGLGLVTVCSVAILFMYRVYSKRKAAAL